MNSTRQIWAKEKHVSKSFQSLDHTGGKHEAVKPPWVVFKTVYVGLLLDIIEFPAF